MSEAGVQVERLARIIKAMDDELSASQAREAELRGKLRATEMMNSLQAQSIGMLSKELEAAEARCAEVADVALRNGEALLAAEARIKESQEQEPFGFLELAGRGAPDFHFKCFRHGQMKPVYEKPFIQPELAELQRENAELRDAITRQMRYNKELAMSNEELRKLLESKVPEGWQLVPKEPTDDMIDSGYTATEQLQSYAAAKTVYYAMLNSAPQPKEPKESNSPETDLDEALRRQ